MSYVAGSIPNGRAAGCDPAWSAPGHAGRGNPDAANNRQSSKRQGNYDEDNGETVMLGHGKDMLLGVSKWMHPDQIVGAGLAPALAGTYDSGAGARPAPTNCFKHEWSLVYHDWERSTIRLRLRSTVLRTRDWRVLQPLHDDDVPLSRPMDAN